MNYTFITSSEKAWKVMLESISQAQKSIYLEMYIFTDDMKKHNFFDTLSRKAQEGIQIKLILDSFGSIDLSNNDILKLRESGIEILFLSYLLHRAHRKILIIDESVAFIGGVNLHQSARFWNDLMIRIKGRIVKNIISSFAKSYINAGGKDPMILSKKKKIFFVKMNAWIVDHSPVRKDFNLKRTYKKHLNMAQNHIILVTPYFMPSRWLRASLHQATLRGVKVEILVPRNTDSFIIDRVNFFYIYRMARLGIVFYLEKNMNHAKAMIIDNNECMIGSQNLDFLSFNLNSEIGVFFRDKKITQELLEILNKWKMDAYIFDPTSYKPRWFDYILSLAIRVFYRVF